MVQIGVGAAIVLTGAPLALAATHNAVAALLLMLLLTLTRRPRRSPALSSIVTVDLRDHTRPKVRPERRGAEA